MVIRGSRCRSRPAQTQNAPGNVGAASAIYLTAGGWPTGGGQLSDPDFNVALATAEWAVGIPASNGPLPCVPLDQARESIAIWLAILAARPSTGELQGGLTSLSGRQPLAEIGDKLVPAWMYPGQRAGQIAPSGPLLSATGYLLARAMTSLPEQKVSQILKARRASWLDWRTTDAQLAAALGIHMPSASSSPGQRWPTRTSRYPQTRYAAPNSGLAPPAPRSAHCRNEPHQEVPVTSPSPSIPHAQGVRGQPARRTRRPRLSWLRALPLLARYIIRTMRWATLIAGCLASLAVFTILVRLTHHDQATFWLDQGTIRDGCGSFGGTG